MLTIGLIAVAEEEALPSKPLDVDAANLRAFVELVRSDVKTQKGIILSQNIDFTEDEALEFWPLYREYDLELNTLYDQRFALIKRYAATYDTLTEEQARRLADDALSLEEKRTALKRKYFKKFAKVITAKKAARFFQIENQINTAIDLRIAASLPLIK
ncbi:MAG: hypothetical protein L0Y72_07935 [Gemmataceae bacterium]|nr:hypothetical protein [Gemmataceae bacterium]